MYQALPPLDYFRLLVSDAASIPLLEAAASIALDAYPTLDLQGFLDEVERLARQLAERCRSVGSDHARLERTLRFFHRTHGFAGNVANYYDPDNSYLHRVLETRRGIPITLSVLFVELARGVGLDAHGIGFPGHFLARVNLPGEVVVIDTFTGTQLDADLLARLGEQHGLPPERLLAPATPRQILVRMLGNLRQIHAHRGEDALREKVETRIRILGG